MNVLKIFKASILMCGILLLSFMTNCMFAEDAVSNLITNGDFENKLAFWKITDGGSSGVESTVGQIDEMHYFSGLASLKVVKNSADAVWANSSLFPLKPQASYSLKIAYKTENTDNKEPVQVRLMTMTAKGKPLPKNYLWVRLGPATEWTTSEKVYDADADAEQGLITIFFNGKGNIWIDNIILQETGTNKEQTIEINGKNFSYKPRFEMADPTRQDGSLPEKNEAIIFYQRDPRMIYPDSIPQPDEKVTVLKKFAVPGEIAAYCFAVYAGTDKTLIDFQASDLTGGNNEAISGNLFQKKTVSFWKQAASGARPSYYIIPELLENFEKLKITSNSSRIFWLQLKVPDEVKSGRYSGKVKLVFENNQTSELPLSLNILPFKLEETKASWMMFTSVPAGKFMPRSFTRAEQVRYFRDMSEYGITGIIPLRIFPVYDYNAGKIENLKFAPMSFADLFSIMKEAGLKGPFVWEMEHILELGLIEKITGKKKSGIKWPLEENSLPAVQDGFKFILSEVDKTVRKHDMDWYYFGIDEPANEGRMPQALWEWTMARQAGVKIATAVYYYDHLAPIAPHVDVDINVFQGDSQESFKKFQNLAETNNFKYWFLGAGCYGGQEGGLMPNRYLCGFLFYKLGAPAHVSWFYQWVKGSPDDDFDGATDGCKDACITYPCSSNSAGEVSLSTLQWEGIREGIIDYKYADTLQKYINRADDKKLDKEAEKARRVLAKVMAAVPWRLEYEAGNCYSKPGNFSSDLADKLRWLLAEEISRLKELLK